MTDPDRSTDFGGRMRRLREQRGVTLRDIADKTKISVGTLEALEKNDLSRLPGGIFSRAVVRAYAEEIGADPETGVREFIAQFPHESVVGSGPGHHGDYQAGEGRKGGRRAAIIAAILVPLAAILVWSIFAL
jgi:cytoskeleton protein RodZ